MNKIPPAIFVLYGLTLTVAAKSQTPCMREVQIAPNKPTIYMTFERVGHLKPELPRLIATGAPNPPKDAPNSTPAGEVEVVWLRLHNNTRWAINFPTDSLYLPPKVTPLRLCDGRGALGLLEGIEVNARYEVESKGGYESVHMPGGKIDIQPIDAPKPPAIRRSDALSTSWLPPGRSVIFHVPREHLAKHFVVYVPFNYEWESSGREPEHRVYFRSHDLPEKVR